MKSIDDVFEFIFQIEEQRVMSGHNLNRFDTVTWLFIEKNQHLENEIIPFISGEIVTPDLQNTVIHAFKNRAKKEYKKYADSDEPLHQSLKQHYNNMTHLSSFDTIINGESSNITNGSLFAIKQCYSNRNPDDPECAFIDRNVQILCTLLILFRDYVERRKERTIYSHPYNIKIENLYRSRNIDLPNTHTQFDTYGLISITSDVVIINTKDKYQIVDNNIGVIYDINVTGSLLAFIKRAIDENWIGNISFSIKGMCENQPLLEEVERGAVFSSSISTLPSVTKLYNAGSYDDALWVKVDHNMKSITFEEICNDFNYIDEKIITQIVHLLYKHEVEDDKYYIYHIDHEFIFYEIDDFNTRVSDPYKKGSEKVKTFKIDNARIPFDFKLENTFFIEHVLNCYFTHKDLVAEYFSNISNDDALCS
jgi:hypothetical protein